MSRKKKARICKQIKRIKQMTEDVVFQILYYAVKTISYANIIFIIWIVLSWAEIAFTIKTPDHSPTYSQYNAFILFMNLF